MPKAYSYIRMSTEKQLKGDSLRRQVEKSAQYARENGLELDTTFSLRDIGFSAFDGSNVEKGQLGKFLTAVRLGKIEKGSILIVESLDRLTRQRVRPALKIFLDLLEHGISIVTLIDKRIFHPDDVDHQDLTFSLGTLTRAHEESVVKSNRLSEAWKNKRTRIHETILTKRCVAWLKAKEDRSGFEVIPERTDIVRRIFDEAADKGIGADLIARRLNQEHVPTFGKSKGWHKSYVMKILSNRAVLGEFQPRTRSATDKSSTECEAVKGYYPAVIDEATFYRAQSAMAARRQHGAGRKGERITNLFTGLLKCGLCGGPVHFLNKGKKGGRILICDSARRSVDCHRISWRYEEFEKSFLTFIGEIDISAFLNGNKSNSELKIAREEVGELEGKLREASHQRERVFSLILGDEPTNFLSTKLKTLDSEVARLNGLLTATQAKVSKLIRENNAFQESTTDIAELVKRLQAEQTDEIFLTRSSILARLRDLIDHIAVWPGGRPTTEAARQVLHGLFAGRETEVDRHIQRDFSKAHRVFYVAFKDGNFKLVNPTEFDAGAVNYVFDRGGLKNPNQDYDTTNMALTMLNES